MNSMKIRYASALLIACVVISGCVAGRRTIPLNVPASDGMNGAKGLISISGVRDERRFENKPAQANIPSIDGDVNAVSRDMLKTMIGRQRGGFGNAMGDVALKPPATVETEVRALITEGLKRRGYSVSQGTGGDSVDVKIEEFWAWFRPGFAQIAFEAKIKTLISISVAGQQRTIEATGFGREEGQIASDEHWQRAYALAFDDYLKNLDSALAGAGL